VQVLHRALEIGDLRLPIRGVEQGIDLRGRLVDLRLALALGLLGLLLRAVAAAAATHWAPPLPRGRTGQRPRHRARTSARCPPAASAGRPRTTGTRPPGWPARSSAGAGCPGTAARPSASGLPW